MMLFASRSRLGSSHFSVRHRNCSPYSLSWTKTSCLIARWTSIDGAAQVDMIILVNKQHFTQGIGNDTN